MTLIPIKLPAGFHANGTELESAGRWRDGSLVRWDGGSIRPMRGSRLRATTSLTAPRAALTWQDNSATRWIAAADYNSLNVITSGGVVYDITPASLVAGIKDAAINTGFGGGFYGTDTYGSPRVDAGNYSEATTWSLDTWGQYLIACSTADGRLLQWQLNTAADAVPIANAPTDCVGLLSTEERFIFALGAGGDPRKVAWCDQEDNTLWTAASTNQAGSQILQTAGQLMCGVRAQGQAVILTDVDAFRSVYVGPPFVQQFERIGSACGVISRKAVSSTDGGVFWMGQQGFYQYNGANVSTIPCDVLDHVFSDINPAQVSKIWSVSQGQHNEVWWFYPSASSIEIDSYVAYDYSNGVWLIGKLPRTCGVDRGVFKYPLLMNNGGDLIDHEVGFARYDTPVVPFVESAPYQIGGDRVMHLTSMIPDERNQGDVTVTISTNLYPNGDTQSFGPYVMTNPVDLRVSGRDLKFRIDASITDDWRVGVMRVDGVQGGRR